MQNTWKAMSYMLELMVKGIELGQLDNGEGIVDKGGMEGKERTRFLGFARFK